MRVDLDTPVDATLAARIRTGLTEQRRPHLTYTSASRDETTERDVDPLRVLSVDGRWYLEAWCHRARGVRTFRLDRVEAVEVLDQAAAPPEDLAPRDVVPGIYQGDPEDLLVTLELAPSAAWVAESIPSEQVELREDGSTLMVLRVADPAWLHRLVWREGGAVRVVHPPAAVAAVRDGAAAALGGHTHRTGR